MLCEASWIAIVYENWSRNKMDLTSAVCTAQHLAKQEPRATGRSWHQQRAPSEICHDRKPAAPCPSTSPWLENQEGTVMMDTCLSSSLSDGSTHRGPRECACVETQLCLRQRPAGSEKQNECHTCNSCKMGICRRAGSTEIYRRLCGSTVCHIQWSLSLGSVIFHWLYSSLWNVSQKKWGLSAASTGPVNKDKSAGLIRRSNWFWKQTMHRNVTSATQSYLLPQKWPIHL